MKIQLLNITFVLSLRSQARRLIAKSIFSTPNNFYRSIAKSSRATLTYFERFFYWAKMIIRISEKTCYRAAEYGKRYYLAFLFTRQLSACHRHPIIINFKSRKAHYRGLVGMGTQRFNKLLNSAISLGLASYEGNNLHIVGHNFEKQQFKAKRRKEIAQTDLKKYFQYSVIKRNITQQEKAIRFKVSNAAKGSVNRETVKQEVSFLRQHINNQITLSVRSVAKLLDVTISNAHNILNGLKDRGLTLKQNSVDISKEIFRQLLATGNKSIRFNKETGNYWYQLAQSPVLTSFKGVVVEKRHIKGLAYFDQNYW